MSESVSDTPDKRVEAGVFLTSLLVVGVPYWRLPYNSVNVPDAFYGTELWLVAVAPLILARFARSGLVRSLVISALVPGAVVMLRVIVEVVQDPTSNNLWPLALAIVLVLVAVLAAAGAVIGWLLGRMLR